MNYLMCNRLYLRSKLNIGEPHEIVDTQITQKLKILGELWSGTIDSFSEDESSRITLTFETDLDLDDVTNDVKALCLEF